MSIKNTIQSLIPHTAPILLSEKIRSGIASGVAIFLLAVALKYLPHSTYPLLMLSSMAASAALLYAVPHSPLSQPWNLIGGHFLSALAGWVCILLIQDPLIAAGVAVGAAIFLMHYFNCLHPPGAATALTLILSSTQFQNQGWKWVMFIVLINAVISLFLALFINNMLPGRRYPMRQLMPTPPEGHNRLPIPQADEETNKSMREFHINAGPFISLDQHDLEWALSQMNGVIDVSEEDLGQIYAFALRHAQDRIEAEMDYQKNPI